MPTISTSLPSATLGANDGVQFLAGQSVHHSIQAFTGTTAEIDVDTTSPTVANLAGGCMQLWLTADQDCYVRINSATGAATSDYFPVWKRSYVCIMQANVATLSVIRASTSGNLHILEILGG